MIVSVVHLASLRLNAANLTAIGEGVNEQELFANAGVTPVPVA